MIGALERGRRFYLTTARDVREYGGLLEDWAALLRVRSSKNTGLRCWILLASVDSKSMGVKVLIKSLFAFQREIYLRQHGPR